MRRVRVATFNILSGRTPGDDTVDKDRVRRSIAALDADVLALQEVDRHQPRSGGLDLTAVAAEAMGAVDHRFVAALTGTPATWTGAVVDEPEGVPSYGIALLSRYPVSRWQVARLPPAPVRLPYRFDDSRRISWVRDEPRVAIRADVEAPNGPLCVVTTHLSFLPMSSSRQLRMLAHSLGTGTTPLVLTGDLNMSPGRAERITGLRSLATGLTFPAHRPAVQLDHLLGDATITPLHGGAVASEISDHRALVVELPGPVG